MKWLGALGACLAVSLMGACGGDDDGGGGSQSSGGCSKTPLDCAADQTCWPANAAGHLACTPAPSDQTQGKSCTLIVAQATCAPGFYCFPSGNGSATGSCEPFCQNGSCSNGGVCAQVGIVGGSEFVAVCTPPATDGGTGGSAGSGSGGSAGSASGGSAGSGGASGSAGSSG